MSAFGLFGGSGCWAIRVSYGAWGLGFRVTRLSDCSDFRGGGLAAFGSEGEELLASHGPFPILMCCPKCPPTNPETLTANTTVDDINPALPYYDKFLIMDYGSWRI